MHAQIKKFCISIHHFDVNKTVDFLKYTDSHLTVLNNTTIFSQFEREWSDFVNKARL